MPVWVENAGYGSTVAAPIAKEIIKGFFYPDSTSTKQLDSLSHEAQLDTLKMELQQEQDTLR